MVMFNGKEYTVQDVLDCIKCRSTMAGSGKPDGCETHQCLFCSFHGFCQECWRQHQARPIDLGGSK